MGIRLALTVALIHDNQLITSCFLSNPFQNMCKLKLEVLFFRQSKQLVDRRGILCSRDVYSHLSLEFFF